jgi:uncharacterized integral membrane protein
MHGQPNLKNHVLYPHFDIWYILSTAIGLTPGGSSTVHIYTQTVHRTKQLKTLVGNLSGIRTQSDQTKITCFNSQRNVIRYLYKTFKTHQFLKFFTLYFSEILFRFYKMLKFGFIL